VSRGGGWRAPALTAAFDQVAPELPPMDQVSNRRRQGRFAHLINKRSHAET
jgi:hypothetical protein